MMPTGRPPLPPDLRARLGEPEATFGPNRRFRMASAVAGSGLALLGVGSGWAGVAAVRAGWPPGAPLYLLLAGGLITLGVAALVLPRQVPPTWVFVCPRGLARSRGGAWEAVGWADILRVEDATPAGGVSVSQWRVVLPGGEWGFLETHVADCRRLADLLHRKVAGRDPR